MHTHLLHLLTTRNFTLFGFAIVCVFGSFLIGIRSAGEVETFGRSEAQQANVLMNATTNEASPIALSDANVETDGNDITEPIVAGDADGDGTVTVLDAITVLEIAQKISQPGATAFRGDMDGDALLTAADALWILRTLHP